MKFEGRDGPSRRELRLLHQRIADYRAAAKAQPREWRIWASLGTLHFSNNNPDAALEAIERAIAAGADRFSLQIVALHGDVLEALDRLPEAAVVRHTSPHTQIGAEAWDGSDLGNRELTIHTLHSLNAGDVINLSRYLPLVRAAHSGTIRLAVRPELFRLMQSAGADGLVQGVAGCPPRMDGPTVSLWALEHVVGHGTIPAPASLWVPTPPACDLSVEPSPKVGICWASGPRPPHPILPDALFSRNVPVQLLDPLFEMDGPRFISLQLGPAARERPTGLFDPSGLIEDWADTASIVRQLDLVITVDTGVAHLAASLGVPTWVLLPWHAAALWGCTGETTPRYPAMRLFRQPAPGDWRGSIQEVQRAIETEPLGANRLPREGASLSGE